MHWRRFAGAKRRFFAVGRPSAARKQNFWKVHQKLVAQFVQM